MVASILRKIDECGLFIADVSLTYQRLTAEAKRLAPNPNVILETGYALKRLGPERVLLLQHSEYGGPEALPFDLRGNRVITFENSRTAEEQLRNDLTEAIGLILRRVGIPADILPPVELDLSYRDLRIESARHQYRLPVWIKNTGEEILSGWSLEVEFPPALLEPNYSYPIVRADQDRGTVLMRRTEEEHSGPLYPGDKKEGIGIDYYMDDALYERRKVLFEQEVTARFYVGTRCIARKTTKVRDLQKF
jgi:hypothetical protein